MTFSLSSPAFQNRGEIPARYTCEGENVSPPLTWSDAPAGTKSFVLLVQDPDAPDPGAPRITWTHWIVFNIPPDSTGLPEAMTSDTLPGNAREATTDWMGPGYGGPCPPVGRHRYMFTLYALDAVLPDMRRPIKKDIDRAMKGHVLGEAKLMGTYKKKSRPGSSSGPRDIGTYWVSLRY